MDRIYLIALLVTASLTFAGVLGKCLNDNLLQRVGLSLIGLASCVRLWDFLQEGFTFDLDPLSLMFIVGVAMYGLSTMYKLLEHRGGR
jgi:hypothetical protein